MAIKSMCSDSHASLASRSAGQFSESNFKDWPVRLINLSQRFVELRLLRTRNKHEKDNKAPLTAKDF